MPMADTLSSLTSIQKLFKRYYDAGAVGQPYLKAGHLDVLAFICYDAVYPLNTEDLHNDMPDILVSMSNDSWFGKTIGPAQHFQMVRFRSVELGRPMIRSSNNGISALLTSDGHIISQLPQFERGVLSANVALSAGRTPFSYIGSNPIVYFCLAILCGALFLHRRM